MIHLPYILIHTIGFLIMYNYDNYCMSDFGSRIEAFGTCREGVISDSLGIWLAMLAGTLMYISFFFTKCIFSSSVRNKIVPDLQITNTSTTNYPINYIFISGLLMLLLSTFLLVILDTLEFNIFKIRGIAFITNMFLSHLIIAYAFMQRLKIDINVWIIYFLIVAIAFLLAPSKYHILFFLLNLGYYLFQQNKNQLNKIIIPVILGILFIISIYVLFISARDYGTTAFRDLSYFNEYVHTILIKAFVRITLFEPTILTASYPNLQAFRESSSFFINPMSFHQEIQIYFQDFFGYNLEKFGYATGLPLIIYASFSFEGVIIFSFLTCLFFNVLHRSIASVFSYPLIIFIPIYLITMLDAGKATIIFLISLYTFKILKGISK